jgi:hypothetical protein
MRYPVTPEIAEAVAVRLRERPTAFQAPAGRFAGAVAAAVAALVVAVAAIAPAREAVADLFDKINIFEADEVPSGLTYEIEGREVTLEAAESALRLELLLPGRRAFTGAVAGVWRGEGAALFFEPGDGPGYALFETNARVGKGIPTGGEPAQSVEGLGGEAYWLTGLRIVQYEEPDGAIIYESQRVTDQNTLIWSRGGSYSYRGTAGERRAGSRSRDR